MKRNFLISILLAAVLVFQSCPSEPVPEGPIESASLPKASDNTKRLYNYLLDMYGNFIISGQADTSWTTNKTMDMVTRVYTDTGKYPALKGFDFIDLPNSWGQYGQEQIDDAIEWWNGTNRVNGAEPPAKLLPGQPDIHGIVTFCWHWRVPTKRTGTSRVFYTRETDFRIPWKDDMLDTASDDFKTINDDLDKVAALLKNLQDKDIPVLWRPLHEASGGWFWWGASGPASYKALWEYMYDYLGNVKKINNLLWVWNGQDAAWFPDPATVDIVSYDRYLYPANNTSVTRNYASQWKTFEDTLYMVSDGTSRMVALTENGAIPDPDNCKKDNAMWSWFMVWNDRSGSTQGESHQDNYWTGDWHNTQAHKEHVYNHELVITLDELPDLTKYRMDNITQ